METNPNKMTLRELRAEFRAVSAERDDIHNEISAFKAKVAEGERRCMWTARNLLQERADLQARIDRLNLRLAGLGFMEAAGFAKEA